MKAVQLLINSLLPEDLRDYRRSYDAKSLSKLLADVAEKHPDRYAEIAKAIGDVGRKASYFQGETLTLDDFKPVVDRDAILAKMDQEVEQARAESKTDEEFKERRAAIWGRYSDDLEKITMSAALQAGNNLGYSVASGARGKAPQLKAMITTPGLYADYKENIIPMFVRRSFSEGLRPAEFLAGTFGARTSVLSTKRATADGGDLSKLWTQIGSNVSVTEKDCGTSNGIDLDPSEPSLRGRVLAADTAGIPAGTPIDRVVLKKLQNVKGKILVRSPLTCHAGSGMCAKCFGLKMDGKMPKVGESIGIAAANALGEPVTQNALNSKHCILKGSLVTTNNGFVPIENLKVGDTVLGRDLNKIAFSAKVIAVHDQGIQQVTRRRYAYTPELARSRGYDFAELCSTDEHQILGWDREGNFGKHQAKDATAAFVFGERCAMISEEDMGAQPCWDITIDHPDELFHLANGLVVKNTAGQAKGKRTFSGFDVLDAFVQTPETFPYKADVAQADGRVTAIEDAPQGGKYVHVGEEKHYVQPGYEVFVKVGDQVEAGDQLADGIVDAYDIVKTRGLGEGRRYYAERLKQVLDDSGLAANLRNTEVLARGAIDHVVVDDADGIGDYLPDDIASYNRLTSAYTPPETTRAAKPGDAVGQYLQAPALHYSVGTRLTPKMVKRLQDAGLSAVQVDKTPPKFRPEMQRLRTASHNNPDWLAQMSTSYIKDNLADSAVRGQDTNIAENPHWAPRLAYGVGFGEKIETTGRF